MRESLRMDKNKPGRGSGCGGMFSSSLRLWPKAAFVISKSNMELPRSRLSSAYVGVHISNTSPVHRPPQSCEKSASPKQQGSPKTASVSSIPVSKQNKEYKRGSVEIFATPHVAWAAISRNYFQSYLSPLTLRVSPNNQVLTTTVRTPTVLQFTHLPPYPPASRTLVVLS